MTDPRFIETANLAAALVLAMGGNPTDIAVKIAALRAAADIMAQAMASAAIAEGLQKMVEAAVTGEAAEPTSKLH